MLELGPLTPIDPGIVRAMLPGDASTGVSAELASVVDQVSAFERALSDAHLRAADVGGSELDRLDEGELDIILDESQREADTTSGDDIGDLAWQADDGESVTSSINARLDGEEDPASADSVEHPPGYARARER